MSVREHNLRATQRRRVLRSRARLLGTSKRPRLSVSRSLKHISAQLIDDVAARTLVAAHDRELSKEKRSAQETSHALGALLAKKAKEKGIVTAVFDRGGLRYHGRVKAVAEGAREGGLRI